MSDKIKGLTQVLIGEFREMDLSDVIPRDMEFPKFPQKIRVAVGMRRTGKTYLLYQQIRQLMAGGVPTERIFYVNFEDERILPLTAKDLGEMVDAFYELTPSNHDHPCYFFFDEIQNVAGWPVVLRRLLDSRKKELFITGSSAKLLSREIAASLRGRDLAVEVWPLSFREYLRFKKITLPPNRLGPAFKHKLLQILKAYLLEGGFPEIVLGGKGRPSAWAPKSILQGYVNTALLRDIVERHAVSNINVIRHMIHSLIASPGTLFSVNKFYQTLKSQGVQAGKDLLYEYLAYIQDAYLAFTIPLFTESERKKNVNPRKTYAVDTGLVAANSLKAAQNLGHLFENLIYLDLRRRGHEITYYLTKGGHEIDFIGKSPAGDFSIIQVCLSLDEPEVGIREKRALQAAHQELKFPAQIVTLENYPLFLDKLK